jgi:hypothetical protein
MNCHVERRLHDSDQFRTEAGGWSFGHYAFLRGTFLVSVVCDKDALELRLMFAVRVFNTGKEWKIALAGLMHAMETQKKRRS